MPSQRFIYQRAAGGTLRIGRGIGQSLHDVAGPNVASGGRIRACCHGPGARGRPSRELMGDLQEREGLEKLTR